MFMYGITDYIVCDGILSYWYRYKQTQTGFEQSYNYSADISNYVLIGQT